MHTIPPLVDRRKSGGLNEPALYHARLQSDHDFRVWAEVLDLEERQVGSVELLDGQVNFARGVDGPERTASLTLSDPEGALSFGMAFAEDAKDVLWVNRLVRARHSIYVPALGHDVMCTPILGVPTSVGRNGGEVALELSDKSVLADHGVRPRTYKRGMNVRNAIISCLKTLTGEWNFRIPTTRKKLSRHYTVGLGEDDTTPWRLAKWIAGSEMGWRLYYSSDGYVTAEPTSTAKPAVEVQSLLALPNSATSFTDFINYTKVTSRRKYVNRKGTKSTKDDAPYTKVFEAVSSLKPSHRLSEQSLNRHGVPRTLPLVVSDDNLKTQRDVTNRSRTELRTGSDLSSEQTFEIMPLFHLDTGDRIALPLGVGTIAFDECSIPLGTGGNMTLGGHAWVSRPVKVVRVRAKTTVIRKKAKGGKKAGKTGRGGR